MAVYNDGKNAYFPDRRVVRGSFTQICDPLSTTIGDSSGNNRAEIYFVDFHLEKLKLA
ncbi:MAG: hypothetical protein HOP23_01410 [Methylococcaceae bacterium]|nr:hypothetical protein [Methylococcaceae bacterium]